MGRSPPPTAGLEEAKTDLTREQYRARLTVLTDRRPEGAGTLPTAWETPEQRTWEQDLLTLIFGTNVVDTIMEV